jgi:D-alanyl-D-alanine carboxypeptidase
VDDAGVINSIADTRTTFIEALARAGVTVAAPLFGPNRSDKLPPPDSYPASTRVAELVSAPYAQYTKLILKVSQNLGANLSLMLFGLAKGVRTAHSTWSEVR